jgi:hypothetical protein
VPGLKPGCTFALNKAGASSKPSSSLTWKSKVCVCADGVEGMDRVEAEGMSGVRLDSS